MSAFTFDGQRIAVEKEIKLEEEVIRLKRKGLTPKLVSILIGEDKGSKLYLSLKKKAAERVSVKLEIKKLSASKSVSQLVKLIKDLSQNDNVHGIMVQLPLPEKFTKSDREKIINTIEREKDVDGMRDDGPFLSPVVGAVLVAIKEGGSYLLSNKEVKVVVVGAGGFVGKKIVKVLAEMGFRVEGVDMETKNLKLKTKDADILISASGHPGLISRKMIKKGAVVVDVGSPKGDIQLKEVAKKASFITPVPGGVGPLTISFLLENVVEAVDAIAK